MADTLACYPPVSYIARIRPNKLRTQHTCRYMCVYMPQQRRQKEEPYKEGEWEVIWRERFKWNGRNKQKVAIQCPQNSVSSFQLHKNPARIEYWVEVFEGLFQSHKDLIPCIQLVDNIIDRTDTIFILAVTLSFLIYLLIHSFIHSFIHFAVSVTTVLLTLPKRVLYRVWSSVSSSSFQYQLFSCSHPVAAYVFSFVVHSQRSFPLSFLQSRVLYGSSYARCEQSS